MNHLNFNHLPSTPVPRLRSPPCARQQTAAARPARSAESPRIHRPWPPATDDPSNNWRCPKKGGTPKIGGLYVNGTNPIVRNGWLMGLPLWLWGKLQSWWFHGNYRSRWPWLVLIQPWWQLGIYHCKKPAAGFDWKWMKMVDAPPTSPNYGRWIMATILSFWWFRGLYNSHKLPVPQW